MADTSSPNPSSEPEKPAAESSDSSAAELQKTIADAVDIFDHESNKTVDVRYGKVSAETAVLGKFSLVILFIKYRNLWLWFREVGTIVRSLKCCPTEGELHDILAEVINMACFELKKCLFFIWLYVAQAIPSVLITAPPHPGICRTFAICFGKAANAPQWGQVFIQKSHGGA